MGAVNYLEGEVLILPCEVDPDDPRIKEAFPKALAVFGNPELDEVIVIASAKEGRRGLAVG